MPTDIVILAAGKGTRMKSDTAKVLHPLAGKPLLGHVIDTARGLGEDSQITVVIGHDSESVQKAFSQSPVNWVEQRQQLGTGHAVMEAAPLLRDNARVLVLYGDVPLIRRQTLEQLLSAVDDNTLALLTVELDDPAGYGRILRDREGNVRGIVEEKDAGEEEKTIREVNTGVLAAPARALKNWLPRLGNDNAQGEYYLTDLIAMARGDGFGIRAQQPAFSWETQGVNSRRQLQELERRHQQNLAVALMEAGVSIADASRFDCRGTLTAGNDGFIDINCLFEGRVTLGSRVVIGPNCVIRDASIADDVTIKANTVIEGPVTIEAGAEVGPFARLRAGTLLSRGAKVGNFVETKKSEIGPGSKVNHLSYIGDAAIGERVNVGAGTITCNYDGVNKHRTEIGDDAFIGSNTAIVAPATIGRGATIGAGSTISSDVPDDQLAVARARQCNIPGWQRPAKKQKD